MAKLRILIVEDDPDGADVMNRMLIASGAETVAVGSAEEAIQTLETTQTPFDVAVIDLALPEMDGFELMRVLRDSIAFRQLALIAVTAFHTPELKVQALENGFDAYFAKPIDTTLFVRAIDQLV